MNQESIKYKNHAYNLRNKNFKWLRICSLGTEFKMIITNILMQQSNDQTSNLCYIKSLKSMFIKLRVINK